MSRITEFLNGTGPDGRGRSISDVIAMDDAALERHHDFIQWLFPLDQPSGAVPGSPVLSSQDIAAIRASAVARQNLQDAASRMALFYERGDRWLQASDHNHLRITRIIKSLRMLVGDDAAEAFKAAILARARGSSVSDVSHRFWAEA